jgi:ketopantoate reductase
MVHGQASRMKIGVIGAGAVGCTCLLSSMLRGIAREIVVVNRDRKRAKAVVTDLQQTDRGGEELCRSISRKSGTPTSPSSKATRPASSASAWCRRALRRLCCATSEA